MAREATELVNYLEFDHRPTRKRKRAAFSVATASLEPRACTEGSENEISSKRAPPAAKKLWHGSIQLTSSVNVSAVAVFKRFIQSLLNFNFDIRACISLAIFLFSFREQINYIFALIKLVHLITDSLMLLRYR